jgi:hypothetical protein
MRTKLLLVFTAVLFALGASSAAARQDHQASQDAGDHGGPKAGQCEDGLDNDNDGFTDADDLACQQPGCLPSSQTPTKCEEETLNPENPEAGNCDDGIDNDGDGLIDDDDPDCQGETGENPGAGNCSDGIDNDGDGLIDGDDPDCQTPENPGAGNCSDGIDNDGDGLVDGDDPDCNTETGENPGAGNCDDGIDNDGDGLIDADDPDCQTPTPENPGAGNCDDGIDNDGDGLIDADDPDCQGPPVTNLCTGAAGDPGLLTDDTLGQTLWDGGLDALNPLTEDPERNGAISGPLGDALTGTPLEVIGDEASCAVDLLLDENTFPDL